MTGRGKGEGEGSIFRRKDGRWAAKVVTMGVTSSRTQRPR